MNNIICGASDCCFNGRGCCLLKNIRITDKGECGNTAYLEPQELDALRLKFKMLDTEEVGAEPEQVEEVAKDGPEVSETESRKVPQTEVISEDKPKAKHEGVTLQQLKEMYITKNMTIDAMSKELGMARSTLYLKMQKLGVIAEKNRLRSDAKFEEEK
jgi:DNA-binding NtrC family response regulator